MNALGKLIVLEGIDGSGKTLQHALLSDHLTEIGFSPLHISFPDYESSSSAPVRMYLNGEISANPDDINAYAASTFFAVDRYINYKMQWESFYNAGGLILCNRYTTSNITHQMEKLPQQQWQNFADWLCDLEYNRLQLPKPDLVIYLDMHENISQKLIENRYGGNNDKKDIHEKNPEYLARCRAAALFSANHLGWQVIRCFDPATMLPLSPNQIASEICSLADRLFTKEKSKH